MSLPNICAIDQHTLQYIHEHLGDEAFQATLKHFKQEMASLISYLRSHYQHDNLPQCVLLCRKLQASSQKVGATRLSHLARQMSNTPSIELLNRLQHEYHQVIVWLNEHELVTCE